MPTCSPGCSPDVPGLIADLDAGHYFAWGLAAPGRSSDHPPGRSPRRLERLHHRSGAESVQERAARRSPQVDRAAGRYVVPVGPVGLAPAGGDATATLGRATPPSEPRPRPARQAPTAGRIAGLDGIRGLAALFVVVNHIFLRAWPGYPVDHAPFWAAGFIYGRFAVIIFIALSGFSLGLGPARSGWRFDSIAGFARRRA